MDKSSDSSFSRLTVARRRQDQLRSQKLLNRLLVLQNRLLQSANRKLRQRMQELEFLARTDPLTGLANRRAIEETAEYEIGRRSRSLEPLALGLIDIDHFKEINRRYLHPGGDQALIAVAGVFSGCLRSTDQVGRVGGEEFLVVAPQTDLGGARVLAERLRATVARTPFRYDKQTIAVTVSIGFAVASAGTRAEFMELKHCAAAALAEAKNADRNCVILRALGAAT